METAFTVYFSLFRLLLKKNNTNLVAYKQQAYSSSSSTNWEAQGQSVSLTTFLWGPSSSS